jgi:hypothetical protein
MAKRNRGNAAQSPVAASGTDNQPADNGAADTNNAGATDGNTDEAPAAEAAPDPFADVPTVSLGDDVSFDDFTDVPTSDPRKYNGVNATAHAERLPTVKGWKHERAMLTPGTNKKELRAGSVYGTIQQIVQAAGRAGIPSYVVATKLRRMQVGNKRSHYCEGLPPIGWAEGWINTAITKNIAGVHPSKQAPSLRDEVTEGEANVNKAEEQGKLAANG